MKRANSLLAIATLCCVGCSSGMYPVDGKVVYTDGQAATELAGGLVEIQSIDVTPVVVARGVIKEDGSFAVHTNKPGDGAVPGKHRVVIVPPLHAGVSDTPGQVAPEMLPRLLDQRYSSYDTSQLEINVSAGANEVTLEVQRPGYGQLPR
ncbi:MAG: hypothetical protein AB7K24_26030 [Gemmataceae bacterium]